MSDAQNAARWLYIKRHAIEVRVTGPGDRIGPIDEVIITLRPALPISLDGEALDRWIDRLRKAEATR